MSKRNRSATSPESDDKNCLKKPQTEMSTKNLLDAMEAMEKRMMEQARASEERINANTTAQINKLETTLGSRIKELEEQLERMEEKNQETTTRCIGLERRLRQLDRNGRKNNIVITGLEASTIQEAIEETKMVLPNAKLSNIRMINTKGGTKIIGSCESFERKLELMREKRNLKTTTGKKVFVDDDLSKEDGELQYIVRQKAKTLAAEGKTVRIGQRKISVDGKWLYIDEGTKEFQHHHFQKSTHTNRKQ